MIHAEGVKSIDVYDLVEAVEQRGFIQISNPQKEWTHLLSQHISFYQELKRTAIQYRRRLGLDGTLGSRDIFTICTFLLLQRLFKK